jgi:heme/copper-type cytochrome/quinol oxidase subunit 2
MILTFNIVMSLLTIGFITGIVFILVVVSIVDHYSKKGERE